MNKQQRAQLESMVSSAIALANSVNGTDHPTTNMELREIAKTEILAMLDLIQPDPTSWPFVKDKFFYDVYLLARADAGTLTELDQTRPGLNSSNFSEPLEWHRHSIRVAQNKEIQAAGDTKTCSVCGQEKSASKFRHQGGAVCHACRAKKARERKKEEA